MNIFFYHHLKIHKLFSFKDEFLSHQIQDENYLSIKTWDDPVKCAKFIERFTSHNLGDARYFNLKDYTRKDLEGIIHLLHGFYTHFILDNSKKVRETVKCRADDVLASMALVSSIKINEDGELLLSDEVWDIVKKSPHLLKLLLRAEASNGKR